jgi:hypothetical protein
VAGYNLGAWNEHNTILIAAGTSTVFGCNAVANGIITALEGQQPPGRTASRTRAQPPRREQSAAA